MEPATNKGASHTRFVLILVAVIVGAALGGLAVHFFPFSGAEAPARVVARPVKKLNKVTALGRLEPEGGVITLGIPVPDRLESIFPKVKEEAWVDKDQKLVQLESHMVRELELKLSERQLADARAKLEGITRKGEAQIALDVFHLEQVEAMAPLDRDLQKQKIEVLTRQHDNAKKNLERSQALGSTISQQDLEQQKLLALQAEAELQSAKIGLKKLDKTRDLEKKAAEKQLAASKAALSSALKEVPISSLESQRDLAEMKLRDSILRAPRRGKILRILARPGELVGAQQPILQMADTDQMMVTAEVYETDIQRVRKGNKAVITGRALSQELKGEVVEIGAIVGKNRVTDADPTVEVDRRVIDVKIRLFQSAPAASLINHQVKVEIDTDER